MSGNTCAHPAGADGLAALNAARGGLFALGGAWTSLASFGDEYVFGYTVAPDNPDVRQLEFRTLPSVPEPATLALLSIGALFAARRRVRC